MLYYLIISWVCWLIQYLVLYMPVVLKQVFFIILIKHSILFYFILLSYVFDDILNFIMICA